MRARDVMSWPVYPVGVCDTIEYAAGVLADRKVTAAPVVDVAGRLVGMVSEGDLLRHRVPHDPTVLDALAAADPACLDRYHLNHEFIAAHARSGEGCG